MYFRFLKTFGTNKKLIVGKVLRYLYQSGPNREPDDYNMVRHAGTTWSMLDMLASETRSEPAALLLAAIHRAVAYLRKHIEPDPWRPGTLIMNEFGTAKLGGNGLAIVALVDYYRLAPSEELLADIRGLAQWIVNTQSESGQFSVHKLDLASGEASSFLSDYYPGEAILGLMRLYGIDANPLWKNAAAAGARWLINVRDNGKSLGELEHDHWLLYGLNEVYREFPEPLFLAHTRKLVQAILQAQHGGAHSTLPEGSMRVADWQGGWYSPPRTTPAACRVEGLMAAAALLKEYGEPAEVDAILAAAEAGLKFQLQNQIWHEKEMYLADPGRAHGGFHSNLNNWHIRIDYVQHSISALMAYARW